MTASYALQLTLMALHVITGGFWVGAAFVLARFGPHIGGVRLRRAQLLAASAALLIGVWLWVIVSRGWSRNQLWVMQFGALAAIIGAGVQSGLAMPVARRLEGPDGAAAERRLRVIDWAAAVLVGLALVAMVLAHLL
jgi:hypothetical protein